MAIATAVLSGCNGVHGHNCNSSCGMTKEGSPTWISLFATMYMEVTWRDFRGDGAIVKFLLLTIELMDHQEEGTTIPRQRKGSLWGRWRW